MKNSSSLLTVMVLVCGLALSACDKGGGGAQPAAVGTQQIVGPGYTSTLPYVTVSGVFGTQLFAYAFPYANGATSAEQSCQAALQQNIVPMARIRVGTAENFSGRRMKMRRYNSLRWQGNNQSQYYTNGSVPAGNYVFCFFSKDAFGSSVRNQAFETFYGAINFTMPTAPGNEHLLVRFGNRGQWIQPAFVTRTYINTHYSNRY